MVNYALNPDSEPLLGEKWYAGTRTYVSRALYAGFKYNLSLWSQIKLDTYIKEKVILF